MRYSHPKYPNGNLYLSGGMQFAASKGKGWREEQTPILKSMGYYPVDIVALDRAYARVHGEMYGPDNHDSHEQLKSNIREHFVHTDLNLIEHHCDALIVLYDESARRGCGTQAECQHAYNLGLPVFLVSSFEDWKREVPIWLQAITTKIFTSFGDLNQYLGRLPRGILKKDKYGNHHDGNGNYLCFLTGEVFQKRKHHFVSNVFPLYSQEAVDLVVTTREQQADRYQFFVDTLQEQILKGE
jgi:hypothetical protein